MNSLKMTTKMCKESKQIVAVSLGTWDWSELMNKKLSFQSCTAGTHQPVLSLWLFYPRNDPWTAKFPQAKKDFENCSATKEDISFPFKWNQVG